METSANSERIGLSKANLDRIEIILCDTQDGANIGSACRAMKTMGLSHLTLVTDRTYDENRVHTLALHAFDLYENRKEFKNLEDAIADSVLAVAATRRHGQNRKTSCVNPEELAQLTTTIGEGKISIVFGCESSGLTDQQVNACSMVVTIPTSDMFPSLNLSQAVQIICYALFQQLKPFPVEHVPVSKTRVDLAVSRCIGALSEIGYFKTEEEKTHTTIFLYDEFSRASMTEGEIQRMEKIFVKAGKIALHKR